MDLQKYFLSESHLQLRVCVAETQNGEGDGFEELGSYLAGNLKLYLMLCVVEKTLPCQRFSTGSLWVKCH